MGRKALFLALLLTWGVHQMYAQSKLKYSGFFDSYYRTGPVKFTIEPCLTRLYGDLKKSSLGVGFGAGANYQILPPVQLNANFRFLPFSATDHDASRNGNTSGSLYQLNLLGNYFLVYNKMRTQNDRKNGDKPVTFYVSTGISLTRYNFSSAGNGGFNTTFGNQKTRIVSFHTPFIFGLPIKITNRFSLIPEVGYFFTFSDKTDAVISSITRANDGYLVSTIKAEINIKGKRRKPKVLDGSTIKINPEDMGTYKRTYLSKPKPEKKRYYDEEEYEDAQEGDEDNEKNEDETGEDGFEENQDENNSDEDDEPEN